MTKHALLLLAAAAVLGGCSRDDRSTKVAATDPISGKTMAADDTGKNVRDRGATGSVVPTDQSNDSADVDVTRSIRRALTTDNTLSTNAQNVKIITTNGNVVLRGPVQNAAERASVVSKAQHVVGVVHVEDDLEPTETASR